MTLTDTDIATLEQHGYRVRVLHARHHGYACRVCRSCHYPAGSREVMHRTKGNPTVYHEACLTGSPKVMRLLAPKKCSD